jgi:ligand-binding sensor domain-containing protein/signal transduction histidine kinase
MQRKSHFCHPALPCLLWVCLATGFLCSARAEDGFSSNTNALASHLRPPVHPRRNVEDFRATPAQFVRFRVFKTNVREPCLDELEVYGTEQPALNLALSTNGARATASGTLPGYQIHQLEWVHDGLYGNTHSWIADTISNSWVCIELARVQPINRVVWGRDREGYLIDRLATEYAVEVSTNGHDWAMVSSSADRRPLPVGEIFAGYGPGLRMALIRFAPISATLPPASTEPPFEYRLDLWQTEDGLPGNEVTAILQAQDGYIWVGTSAGLARFDGVRFLRVSEAEGIRNNRVLCLFEDKAGTLWVGTDGGGLFHLANGHFQSLTRREGLVNDVVMTLAEDSQGMLWIGTYSGLDCLFRGRLMPGERLPPRLAAPFSRVLDDEEGLWVVINGFLHQVKNRQYVRKNQGAEPASELATASIRRGPSGRLWFGGLSGRLSASSNGVPSLLPQPANLSSDTILDVCEMRNGDLWMGMASTGLRRWRNGQVLSLGVKQGLADNSVRCLLEDREGNLWVGTAAGGLQRVKPKKLQLVTTTDGLTHNVIMSLAEDKEGQVWIGSNGGGPSVGRSRSLQRGSAGDQGIEVPNTEKAPRVELPAAEMEFSPAELSYLLDNESLASLLATAEGELWLGTWNSGLFRKTGSKLEQLNLARPDNDEPVLALCERSAGGLWVGTYQDGLKFLKDGAFTACRTTNGPSANYITSLAEDAEGRLWIGTGGGGLNCFSNEHFTVFTRENGLAGDFVRTLYLDGRGVLWIGTSQGLSRMKQGRLSTITTGNGLWDDMISQILEDEQGRLWFGSNRGISRIPKTELNDVADGRVASVTPVVFGKAEGLESLECTGGFCPAGLKTRDGRLWFSTVKGLAIVDPAHLPPENPPPDVVLEDVRVNTTTIRHLSGSVLQPFDTSKEARIGPRVQRLEFQYTALNFTAPERIRFRYRLLGFDPDWVEANGRRVAEYSRLSPGRYQFQVKACNADGVWNQQGLILDVRCLPAFWQTLWFRLLAVGAILGSVGWAVKRWAVRRLRRRLAVLEQQHALETERRRISRDIHDEMGALLTEISLVSDHGRKHHAQPATAQADFEKISETTRTAVQTADWIVWAVNPQNDSLSHLANYLVHFVEDFFKPTDIRCRLDVPALVPPIPISAKQRHHLLLATKEACTNVVRHSSATEVWVRLVIAEDQFSITVEDNGRGFDPEGVPADHDGLLNLQHRVADLSGRVEVQSAPGRGTCVRISAPLKPQSETHVH